MVFSGTVSYPRPERVGAAQAARPSRARVRADRVPRLRAQAHPVRRALAPAPRAQQARRVAPAAQRGRSQADGDREKRGPLRGRRQRPTPAPSPEEVLARFDAGIRSAETLFSKMRPNTHERTAFPRRPLHADVG